MNQKANTKYEAHTERNRWIIILVIGLIAFTQILFTTTIASGQIMRDRVVKTTYSKQTPKPRKAYDLPFEVKYRLLTMKDYTVFDWLEAETETDGDVILRGYVSSRKLKNDAEKLIAGVAGVKNLSNRLEVLPVSQSDERLRKMLFRAIYNQNTPLFRYTFGSTPSIHIIVKNGDVTLYGDVDSRIDSEMAFVAANAVPQVLRVSNKLQTERRHDHIASVVKTGFYR